MKAFSLFSGWSTALCSTILCLLCFWGTQAHAVDSVPADFSTNDAFLLEQGQWSVGIFAPLRYGLSDKTELSIHPGWALMAPHIGISRAYSTSSNWQLTSHHQIGYPTPLLKKLARPGIGGVLTPDSVIPNIIHLENDVLLSQFTSMGEITLVGGVNVAMSMGEENYNTIDAPYAFQKTNTYQNHLALHLGFGWQQYWGEKFGYRYFVQTWYTPLADAQWVIDEKHALLWLISNTQQIQLGMNVIVGEYPYGWNIHALPTMDWIWVW